MNPFPQLEALIADPTQIDLDQLKSALVELRSAWDEREQILNLYQDELQRELRAKVELCGGIPACHNPDIVPTLSGPALLAARREASHQFNQTFFIMPLSRTAQNPNTETALRAPLHITERARG